MFGIQMPEDNLVTKKYGLAFLFLNYSFELLLFGFGSGHGFGLFGLIFNSIHLIVDLEGRCGKHLKQGFTVVEYVKFGLIILEAIGLEIELRVSISN